MATYTSHLNLKLPDYSDTADIKDLNENFKKIDDAIASGGTGGGTGGGIVTETDPTVPSWAKQPSKPTYTAAEVGALPDTTVIPTVPSALPNPQPIVINGISYDGSERKEITVSAGDGGSITETDPTVPAWAKAENKPSYTAEEVGALPSTYKPPVTSVNGKTGDVSLVASDVGALPNTTVIPTVPTALKNPYPLTINGVSYDGSEAKTVTIESTGGGASVELDTTLTQYGKAADAGAVGNAIAQETAAREAAVNSLNEANAAQDERLSTLEQAGGIVTVEPTEGDVPLLFYSAALPQTKTDTAMQISYMSKTLKRDDADAKTKAQGNSSLSYPKKNQTTKFSQAINFKNWGLQKKYCMKANWIDLTHARNIVSAQLWGDVVKSRANYLDLPELLRTSPNQGAIDGFPALVYANGVYQGRYTINIPKDAWMANMDKTLDNHCILCGENYVSGCFRAAANINGSDWSDELHDTVPDTIKTRWNEIINFVMTATDDEFVVGIGNYFYLDSLIDYYIFGVVSCGLDAFGKNQIYMTYDGQKWIASMYDMDSTWGLWWNGSNFVATDYARTEFQDFKDGEGNLLYIRLEELFYEQIQARWAELKNSVLSYANIMTRFERFIEIVPPHIVKEDYASTTGGGKFTGIPSQNTNHIQQLRAYVAARLPYADEWFASLTPAVEIPCTGITLDKTELTFTAAGTQTLTPTVTPENTTDTVVWSSDDAAVASVDSGVVTAKANGSTTITATCGAHSATCSVSVSGVEAGDGILYQLAQPTTFNGTSDYIDTGVKLFDTQKDFTVFMDCVNNVPSPTTMIAVAHAMNEVSPWPGFVVMASNYGYETQIVQGVKCSTQDALTNLNKFKTVARVSGTTAYVRIVNTENSTVRENSKDITYEKVEQNLLLGCYQDSNGTKGRFWSGTINRCVVWNRALSDEEISAYFALTPCTGITLDQTTLTFDGAGTQTLTATVTPSDTTDAVVWSTDADTVATVSGGVVTAVGNGNATITATCGEYSVTCAVSVSGIETGSADEFTSVADLQWVNDKSFNVTTGQQIDQPGESVSNKFTLQNKAYKLEQSGSNGYTALYIWDKNDNYIGSTGLNSWAASNSYFWPGENCKNFKFALKTTTQDGSYSVSGVSLAPYDNQDSAQYKAIDIAENLVASTSNYVEIVLENFGSNYYDLIANSSNLLFSKSGSAIPPPESGALCLGKWQNNLYIQFYGFGSDVDAAKEYWAGKQLIFSKS